MTYGNQFSNIGRYSLTQPSARAKTRIQKLQFNPYMGALGFAVTGAQTSSLVGAGSSLVKTRNPTVSYAASGAAAGATFGPIGAAIGAVLGAIGGAFIGSKRPESELWDKYKGMAGQNAGHMYDNNFRNGAFVGLMRLGKNTFPPRASGKYGPRDDAKFLNDLIKMIADAFRTGQLTLADSESADVIYNKLVGPWIDSMGTEKNPDWRRWETQIVKDQIDAWLWDAPIIATSYSTAGYASPRVSVLAAELMPTAPATSAPGIVVTTPGNASSAPKILPLPASGVTPVVTLPIQPASGGALQPAQGFTPVPTSAADPNLTTYISSLLAQGQSQQDAFTSALNTLSANGVTPTPQVQQQVADAVKSAGSALPSWAIPAAMAGGVALLFMMARKRRGH